MLCRKNEVKALLHRFRSEEDGVATIDWILMCCGATAAGIMALNWSQQSLGRYNADVRNELQAPYFQTSWTQQLNIPPEEYWSDQDPIIPDPTTGGSGNETITTVSNGNGNNGHGNDADGCDASNPGNNPNCAGDTTDDDGTPGSSGSNTTGNTTTGNTGTTGSGGGGAGSGTTVVTTQSAIAVTNASFESTSHGSGGWSAGVPGWSINTTWGADVGDFNPGQWSIDMSTVTGNNVAYLYHDGGNNSATMWQTFSETYTAGSTYEFAVDIGDGAYSFSGNMPYELNIFAGSTLIGTASGSTGDIDALATATVTSTVNNPALNGQAITFQIVHPAGSGGDLLVDNVRGTVTSQGTVSTPTGPQVVSGVIQGCPTTDYIAEPIQVTASELDDDKLEIEVTASGSTNAAACSNLPGNGSGYFNANPTVTLDLSGFDDSWNRFEIKTDKQCDAVILLLDAQGNWHYGDLNRDDNRLRLRDNLADLNGLVSIWVGMEDGGTCTGEELTIDARD